LVAQDACEHEERAEQARQEIPGLERPERFINSADSAAYKQTGKQKHQPHTGIDYQGDKHCGRRCGDAHHQQVLNDQHHARCNQHRDGEVAAQG
jgi:hypothetical protein